MVPRGDCVYEIEAPASNDRDAQQNVYVFFTEGFPGSPPGKVWATGVILEIADGGWIDSDWKAFVADLEKKYGKPNCRKGVRGIDISFLGSNHSAEAWSAKAKVSCDDTKYAVIDKGGGLAYNTPDQMAALDRLNGTWPLLVHSDAYLYLENDAARINFETAMRRQLDSTSGATKPAF